MKYDHNVIWSTPSADSTGSMPLGNGDIALNAWVEPSGDLLFYIAKTDTWGEFGQLYKVGRIRVSLRVNDVPLFPGANFCWTLKLENGAILVQTDRGEAKLWVDANQPAIHLLARGPAGLRGTVKLEIWRTAQRELAENEKHGLHMGSPYPVFHEADHLFDAGNDELAWCHHNRTSSWANNLAMQGLEALIRDEDDPLMHRTFGGVIRGKNLIRTTSDTLSSKRPSSSFSFTVTVLTKQSKTPRDWLVAARGLSHEVPVVADESAWNAHLKWWGGFWERSWINMDGSEAARKVSTGYTLQRFMNGCAGRGAFPIKFNGSLFTVDWRYPGENHDADYRRWGPGYWHQNTRLPYWSMLHAGDFEMMKPLFEMYLKGLPLARERCRKFCGHEGAFFLETMYFWGAYLEDNYGWSGQREKTLPGHLSQNQYIRHHNSSSLEVVHHALTYYRFTGDVDFLRRTALPLAEAVLDYYDLHYHRHGGKLHIFPAQAIEQWWDVENPLPEIAGLTACLNGLLALPESLLPAARISQWRRLRTEIPPLPSRSLENQTLFAAADIIRGGPCNSENPELYEVFPYRLCGLLSEDLDQGVRTFWRRTYTHDEGWAQDGIQAALLGLTEEARKSVVRRFSTPSAYARFPAFWGPNFDWIPDQDHGGTAMHALQMMVLQASGDSLLPLPAWPMDWDVDFKLHAPGNTVVEGKFVNRKTEQMKVTPGSRKKDIVRVESPGKWCSPPVKAWQISKLVPKTGDVTRAKCVALRGNPDWQTLRASQPEGFANVHSLFGEADGLVYLGNIFKVSKTGVWTLYLGHDGGVKVFVDGQKVLTVPQLQNPAAPRRSKVDLSLSRGRHEIVVAFDTANGMGWGIFASFEVPEHHRGKGKPLFPQEV